MGLLLAVLAPLGTLRAQSAYVTPYTFTTWAGLTGQIGWSDTALLFAPVGMAMDGAGNVYVSDVYYHTIRKITPGRVVTTLAGTANSSGKADGTGPAARFNGPRAVAVDGAGNVYVADTYNHTIRKITSGGVVTTLAGWAGHAGTADGTGLAAQFNQPQGVAVDGAGNVYVGDSGNNTIRLVTPGGVVTTVAGTAGVFGSNDGTGPAAQFVSPEGLALDGAGNLYVADYYNSTIRKIAPGGVVTTLAGSAGNTGSTDGTGAAALFNQPAGVAVDASGNVYVGDTGNHLLRVITPGGVVTTRAGSAGHAGTADGSGSFARFNNPQGVVVDGSGNAFLADSGNGTVRKITAGGAVTTFAGRPGILGGADGSPGLMYSPTNVALDSSGNVYVADSGIHTIRKISPAGVVTTLAGTAGSSGTLDATGSAARFNTPYGLAVDAAGNVYVADQFNHRIRMITPDGVVTTLAGNVPGAFDATGSAAKFYNPQGVAVDGAGNVYVADNGNNTIRKVTSAGVVTTLAGLAGSSGPTDGTGSAARFNSPSGLAVDGAGNVFVADIQNHTIREITPGGAVTTLAGAAGVSGSADGTGGAARFKFPLSVAVDGAGNVYVSDFGNHTIRKITSAGVVTTLGGAVGAGGSADGTGRVARFYNPRGVAVDGSGTVYVADTTNFTIRKGVLSLSPGDLGGDGHADILWQNSSTGRRGVWLMNGTGISSWLDFGVVGTDWRIAGVGDFNGDGQADLVWENTSTGERGFWLMNGTTFSSWKSIGTVSTDWHIAAVGDFNGDGKPDLLWENTGTGDRGFWLMSGTTFTTWQEIGVLSTALKIVGAGDFNGDGKTDILWENTSTGKRIIWLMNGTAFSSSVNLGIISTDWHIAAIGDFNGDGKPDILWENTVTGERGFWLMDGTAFSSWQSIGIVTTDWRIAP